MVSRQGGLVSGPVEHQRHDEPDFDDSDGDGQHQCAEGLAELVCDDLGVMDRRDDGTDQRRGAYARQDRPHVDEKSDDEKHDRGDREQTRP